LFKGGIKLLNFLKLIISFEGRLNRQKFLLLVLFYIFSLVILVSHAAVNSSLYSNPKFANLIEIIIGVLIFISYISALIRRSHDFNQSGFELFSRAFIPFNNFKVMYELFTKKGSNGKNDYGKPN
jgi:uncharacterized membrane protein YhaH (DUF805 family)